MRSLPKPVYAARDVYIACAKRVRNKVKRRDFLAAREAIEDAAALYDSAGQKGALYEITTQQASLDGLTAEDLAGRYTRGLVQGRVAGVYEDLLTSTHRCPFCVQRDVSTLDHYLPKAAFPAFAVLPLNLVPCCLDCNVAKGDFRPLTAQHQIFHPYFDNCGGEKWLHAVVIEQFPVTLRFEVRPPISWSSLEADRIRHHFSMFGLGVLYASQAVDELQIIRLICRELFNVGGSEALRRELQRRATSSAAYYINSWQTAAYTALANSDWYCGGGFGTAAPMAVWH